MSEAKMTMGMGEAMTLFTAAVRGALAGDSETERFSVLDSITKFADAIGVELPPDFLSATPTTIPEILKNLHVAVDASVVDAEKLIELSCDGPVKNRFEEIAGELRRVRARIYSMRAAFVNNVRTMAGEQPS